MRSPWLSLEGSIGLQGAFLFFEIRKDISYLIVTYRWQIGVGYELTYAYREEKVMSYARSTCTTSNIYLHYTRCRKVMVTKDLAGAFCKQKTAREKMGDLLSGEFEKHY